MKLQSILLCSTLAVTSVYADVTIDDIKKASPEISNIQEIKNIPDSELIEILVGKSDVFYITNNMRYAIRGEIIDLKSKKNLTQERVSELRKIDFSTLDLSRAIKIGSGNKKMASFEDPNCGYCKKLTKEIASMKDVSVYVFLLPILGPDSESKSKNIWCAKNQAETYINWMVKGVTPPDASCDAIGILQENKKFAMDIGIRGTPGIIFQDGKMNPGFLPAKEIEKRL